MKRRRHFLLAAAVFLLSSCGNAHIAQTADETQPAAPTETIVEPTTEITDSPAETTSKTSTEITDSPTETAAELSSEITNPPTETTAESPAETTPDTSAETTNPPAEVIDTDSVTFYDYKFIENYAGSGDPDEYAEKSVSLLMSTDIYAESMAQFDRIEKEFGKPYLADGKIVPQLHSVFPEDYDGDGKSEAFVVWKMPVAPENESYSILRYFLIFEDSTGNLTLLDQVSNLHNTVFLDYGDLKQITFGGAGEYGFQHHNCLFGVKDGAAKILCAVRGFYHKQDCFLATFGWQNSGSFQFFDAKKGEYVPVASVEVPKETIAEMDTDGLFNTDEYREFRLLGEKYYLAIGDIMDCGTPYTYEDGKFVPSDNLVRVTWDENAVVINYDKAVESMIKVE